VNEKAWKQFFICNAWSLLTFTESNLQSLLTGMHFQTQLITPVTSNCALFFTPIHTSAKTFKTKDVACYSVPWQLTTFGDLVLKKGKKGEKKKSKIHEENKIKQLLLTKIQSLFVFRHNSQNLYIIWRICKDSALISISYLVTDILSDICFGLSRPDKYWIPTGTLRLNLKVFTCWGHTSRALFP